MNQDAFSLLKDTCRQACHDRHACAEGYRQMLASENVSQMMATWRANWEDVVRSKYADIIAALLPAQYPSLRSEMNRAGIFFNECPPMAKKFARVLIASPGDVVHVYGHAEAYVLGPASVVAHDHSQVYNPATAGASITLLDYAYGNVAAGRVVAQGRSRLVSSARATLQGHATCQATGGSVVALGYMRVDASGDARVYARNGQSIYLEGGATLQPLINANSNE